MGKGKLAVLASPAAFNGLDELCVICSVLPVLMPRDLCQIGSNLGTNVLKICVNRILRQQNPGVALESHRLERDGSGGMHCLDSCTFC